MKITTRLTLLSLAFAVLIVAIGLISVETFSRISNEINQESHDVSLMIRDVFELNIVTYQYMMHHEKRMQQQWHMKYDTFGKLLDRMKEKETHPECHSILATISADYQALGNLFSLLQANFDRRKSLINGSRPEMEISMTAELEGRLMTQTLMRTQKIVSGAFEVSDAIISRTRKLQQRTNLIVFIFIIGFVILSICISFFAVKSITVPIRRLVKGTEIVGAGDLEYKLGTGAKDEIGQFSRADDRMTENLKQITASRDELEREISERKRVEEKLKQRDKFLNAVLDSIQDGISVLDQNLNIVRVNQTMRKWYADRLPLEGKKCYEAYHGKSSVCEICPTLRTLKTGKLEMDEIPLRQQKEINGTLEVYSFPMLDDTGKPTAVVEYIRDITRRKRIQEEREKLILELKKALEEVKLLSGLLPICSFCKKIRNDMGYWEKIEMYIEKHSDAKFSHGLCGECLKKHYPEMYEEMKRKGKIKEGQKDLGIHAEP